MKCFVLLAGLFFAAAAHASERDERFVFPVTPGCLVAIDSYRGSIFVTESDVPEVSVLVHFEIGADSEAEAEQMRAKLKLDVSARDNQVTILARNPSETRMRWVWREDKQIDLTYRITVPRRCDLNLKVINGHITVGRLAGRMRARVENGNVFFRGIEGSGDVAAERGNVVVSRCSGDLKARVLEGVIRTGTIGGAADLKNSSGEVEILVAHGAVQATAEAGDLIVGFPRRIGGGARLTSLGGNVRVTVDPLANCRIAASSVWGDVHSRVPIAVTAGASGRSRLEGALNGDGPLLTLRASGGNVKIEPGEAPFE